MQPCKGSLEFSQQQAGHDDDDDNDGGVNGDSDNDDGNDDDVGDNNGYDDGYDDDDNVNDNDDDGSTAIIQHIGGVCPSPAKLQGLLLTLAMQYYAICFTFKL